MRFVATTANASPRPRCTCSNRETGAHEAFQLHVLSVRAGRVSHVVAFHAQDGLLFEKFGLAPTL